MKATAWLVGGLLVLMAVEGGERSEAAGRAADPRLVPNTQLPTVPLVSAVTLNPSSVLGGTQVGGTVLLIHPAPAGGVTVKLQSSNPTVAAAPSGVVVQPGTTSATFVVQTYLTPTS